MIIPVLLLSVILQAPAAPTDLDFWVGSWDVYEGATKVGTDRVEKVEKGYGIVEKWTDVEGGTGMSLFYYMPAKNKWKQVWITEVGQYKEKYSEPVVNGIRFAGTVFLKDGREVRDRTTLTMLPEGQVHQVIEFTKDGKKWQTSFDAIYKRPSS